MTPNITTDIMTDIMTDILIRERVRLFHRKIMILTPSCMVARIMFYINPASNIKCNTGTDTREMDVAKNVAAEINLVSKP